MRGHTHALDGQLHRDCAECDRILDATPSVKRAKDAEALSERYAKIAELTLEPKPKKSHKKKPKVDERPVVEL